MSVHFDRALLLYQQSRLDLAEQEARQALVDEPENASAHALLAICLCDRKDYPAATEQAQEAIGLAPNSAFSHFALSYTLYHRHHHTEAEAAIEQALELAPWDADYHGLLASIRFDQRNWQAALEAAERGLELEPEHTGCINIRAMALAKLGRTDEAGAIIRDALRHDPENALTHANQGWTLLQQSQPKQALEHFREALRLEPNLEWAREGIVESLKARHWLYRQMLRYFLWMGRLSRRAQFGVLIALLVAQQFLTRLPAELAVVGNVLFWILLVFVYLTWTADPLFNLLLRLHPLGRLALSREQIRASNCVGGCLALAILSLAWGIGTSDVRYALVALAAACLVLPVAAVFQSRPGWPRIIMMLYTILVGLAGTGGAAILLLGTYLPQHAWNDALALMRLLFGVFFLGVIGSTWLFNLLQLMPVKR